jgi:hypothetical protein
MEMKMTNHIKLFFFVAFINKITKEQGLGIKFVAATT